MHQPTRHANDMLSDHVAAKFQPKASGDLRLRVWSVCQNLRQESTLRSYSATQHPKAVSGLALSWPTEPKEIPGAVLDHFSFLEAALRKVSLRKTRQVHYPNLVLLRSSRHLWRTCLPDFKRQSVTLAALTERSLRVPNSTSKQAGYVAGSVRARYGPELQPADIPCGWLLPGTFAENDKENFR